MIANEIKRMITLFGYVPEGVFNFMRYYSSSNSPSMNLINARLGISVRFPTHIVGKRSFSGHSLACSVMEYGAHPSTWPTIVGVSVSRSIALMSSRVTTFSLLPSHYDHSICPLDVTFRYPSLLSSVGGCGTSSVR